MMTYELFAFQVIINYLPNQDIMELFDRFCCSDEDKLHISLSETFCGLVVSAQEY
jgi:hypothetical protein